jgi:hypothetical protein
MTKMTEQLRFLRDCWAGRHEGYVFLIGRAECEQLAREVSDGDGNVTDHRYESTGRFLDVQGKVVGMLAGKFLGHFVVESEPEEPGTIRFAPAFTLKPLSAMAGVLTDEEAGR